MNDIPEKTTVTEIFNNKFYECLISDQNTQINFLKIYPLFKKDQNIMLLWKQYYLKLHEHNSIENQMNCDSMIEFLTFALEYDLVEYKTTEILSIITMMDSFNDVTNRDLIKASVIKGKTNTCHKKIALIDDPRIFGPIVNINIKELSPQEIALELTRKFAYIVEKITYHELLYVAQHDNKYNKYENELITPIEVLIDDFHKLSYIVFYSILVDDKNDIARIKTLKHILKICEELKNLNNFHALFAIIAALNNSIIQRLDNLWKNKKFNNVLVELTEMINPCNNYRNYRNLVKKNIKNNMVPYIGLTICDIKHVLECPLYDIPNNDFNTDVYNIVLAILSSFKNIQLNYTITKNEKIYKWFSNINTIHSESYFYDISNSLKSDFLKIGAPKVDVHEQLIEQLNNVDNNLESKKPEVQITPFIKIIDIDDKSHDSVDDMIRLTNIPQNTKRKKHRSMPARIKKDNEIVKLWTVNEVQEWLYSIGMEAYSDIFLTEEIDGLALSSLTNEYLRNDLNITKLGHRLKILEAIKNI